MYGSTASKPKIQIFLSFNRVKKFCWLSRNAENGKRIKKTAVDLIKMANPAAKPAIIVFFHDLSRSQLTRVRYEITIVLTINGSGINARLAMALNGSRQKKKDLTVRGRKRYTN